MPLYFLDWSMVDSILLAPSKLSYNGELTNQHTTD